MADIWTIVLLTVGCIFYAAGTVGVLRFADARSRLHALTKADTVGLGFVVVALIPQVGAWAGAKMLLIWVLALAAAAVVGHLLARWRTGPSAPR